jgi:hypothetical protein
MEGSMLTGGCLCGTVRYEADGEPLFACLCYCRDCQRASGAGHVPVLGMPADMVRVSGRTQGFTVTGGSGRPATRHFCPACGSCLFGTSEATPSLFNVYAGTLDDPSRFRPEAAIFTRSRAPWDPLPDGLPSFDALPPGV